MRPLFSKKEVARFWMVIGVSLALMAIATLWGYLA